MSQSKFWIASLAVLILVVLWAWLLGAVGLRSFEAPAWGAWSWWLAKIAFSLLFVFIFTKGMSGAKGEGFRYGLFLGLLWYLPAFFMDWPSSSFGASLWHAVVGTVGYIIFGMGACLLYKPEKAD